MVRLILSHFLIIPHQVQWSSPLLLNFLGNLLSPLCKDCVESSPVPSNAPSSCLPSLSTYNLAFNFSEKIQATNYWLLPLTTACSVFPFTAPADVLKEAILLLFRVISSTSMVDPVLFCFPRLLHILSFICNQPALSRCPGIL